MVYSVVFWLNTLLYDHSALARCWQINEISLPKNTSLPSCSELMLNCGFPYTYERIYKTYLSLVYAKRYKPLWHNQRRVFRELLSFNIRLFLMNSFGFYIQQQKNMYNISKQNCLCIWKTIIFLNIWAHILTHNQNMPLNLHVYHCHWGEGDTVVIFGLVLADVHHNIPTHWV